MIALDTEGPVLLLCASQIRSTVHGSTDQIQPATRMRHDRPYRSCLATVGSLQRVLSSWASPTPVGRQACRPPVVLPPATCPRHGTSSRSGTPSSGHRFVHPSRTWAAPWARAKTKDAIVTVNPRAGVGSWFEGELCCHPWVDSGVDLAV